MIRCEACEKVVRPSTGIVVENLSDGERLVMHRPCVLKIANLLPEGQAVELHHQCNVQAVFRDGDRAVRERMDGDGKSVAQAHRVVFGEAMTEEPTVPQHPIGWVPEDEEAI